MDIRLIDFQFIRTGLPAYDLAYCLYAGATREDLSKLDTYLKIYHDSLTSTLKEFSLDSEKIYSFTNLKEDWKKYCKFGFAMAILAWRLKFADPNKVPEAINLEGGENVTPFELVEGKVVEYNKRVRDLVMHMYNNGFL